MVSQNFHFTDIIMEWRFLQPKDVLKITEDLSKRWIVCRTMKRKTGWNFCVGYGLEQESPTGQDECVDAPWGAELKEYRAM